ncbi:MAG TPA: hypothetical protein PK811_02700 [bacterium]|nr:hypothetical protein [bacterium]
MEYVKPVKIELYFIPVKTRIPLKFGPEILTSVNCARVHMFVSDNKGKVMDGWGETPLSVQWGWPSSISYDTRDRDMKEFSKLLANEWVNLNLAGHPVEIGDIFLKYALPLTVIRFNSSLKESSENLPWLAALICNSAFDIAFHDAYAKYLGLPVYRIYSKQFMENDLSHYLEPANDTQVSFKDK